MAVAAPPHHPVLRRSVAALVAVMLTASACSSAAIETQQGASAPSTTTTAIAETTTSESTTTTLVEPDPTTSTTTTDRRPAPALCTHVPDATGVSVPTFWEEGEVRHFDLEIRKQRTNQPTGSSVTPVRVEALEVNDMDMTLEWRHGTTDLSALGVVDLGPVGAVLDGLPPPPIRYRVNGDGFTVDNVDDLRAYLLDTWDTIGPGLGDEETRRRTLDLFASMSDDSIVQLLAEDPQILHAFDGAEAEAGDRIQLPTSLPNAFGGRPFPAILTLEVATLRDEDNCAVLTMITEPDPEQFLDILFPTLADAFDFEPEDLSGAQLELVGQSFEIRNVVSMQFDLATERVRRIEATQSITTITEGRVDTKILTDVTDQVVDG